MPQEILIPREDLFLSLKVYRKQLLGLRYTNYFNLLKDYFFIAITNLSGVEN